MVDPMGSISISHDFASGCGASCVYPLLGTKKNGWTFLTSEADSMNYQFAKRNVKRNSMQDKITGKFFPRCNVEIYYRAMQLRLHVCCVTCVIRVL